MMVRFISQVNVDRCLDLRATYVPRSLNKHHLQKASSPTGMSRDRHS